ncbi:MAG: hypothetical protein NNA31_12325 [Nitrospira sp.]|nr:hypothetical protein [Nitrospira sp.]
MTRPRKADGSRRPPQTGTAEAITDVTARLQEVLASVHDLSQEGFPYRDAARTKAELQLRECVKQLFGEHSREFQTYRHYRLRVSNQTEVAQSIATIQTLLQIVQDKGSGPHPPVSPLSSSTPTTGVPLNTAEIPQTPPPSKATSNPPGGPSKPAKPAELISTATNPRMHVAPTAAPESSAPSLRPTPSQPLSPTMPSSPSPSSDEASARQQTFPPSTSSLDTSPPNTDITSPPSISSFSSLPKADSECDSLRLVRKICLRLHAVACQLRLRNDARPTIEIQDDHDVQDLLRALLKMEFDDVGVEEWTPSYAGNTALPALLLNGEHIAVVAKKTRPGLTTKELAERIAADAAFHAARRQPGTLFCFVYDPEGRVGSPKQLETELADAGNGYTVEVLVAPR